MLTVGSAAMNAAAALLIIIGFLFATATLRGATQIRVLSLSYLVVILITALTLMVELSPLLSIIYSVFVIVVLVCVIVHLSISDDVMLRILVRGFTLIATCSVFYYKLIPQLQYLLGLNLSVAKPLEVYLLGELTTTIATMIIAAAYLKTHTHPASKGSLAIALGITGIFTALYMTSTWLLSIIVMWTLGFMMFLPFPVYSAALFAFAYAVAMAWSKGDRWVTIGMIMLLLAGRLAQLGYLSMLMITGLALMSFPETFGFGAALRQKPTMS